VIRDLNNGNYYTRTIFRDVEGNPSFRPLAGGTASQINIGRVTGHVSKEELEKLEENKRRKEPEL
jgi:hypothetical protein